MKLFQNIQLYICIQEENVVFLVKSIVIENMQPPKFKSPTAADGNTYYVL